MDCGGVQVRNTKERKRWNVIETLLRKLDSRTLYGAEIGVGSGPTSGYLLETFPNLNLIGVDDYPTGYRLLGGGVMTDDRQARAKARYMFLVNYYRPRLKLFFNVFPALKDGDFYRER